MPSSTGSSMRSLQKMIYVCGRCGANVGMGLQPPPGGSTGAD